MKLKCNKCKTILTKDLRPVKVKFDKGGDIFNKWQVWTQIPDKYHDPEIDGEIIPMVYGNMKSGIFYQTKKEVWNNKIEPWGGEDDTQVGNYLRVIKESPEIVVSGYSLLDGIIPPFQEGYGCCNWSSGRLHCPTCNIEIGTMHLDCYEDYSVRFDVDNVERCYK